VFSDAKPVVNTNAGDTAVGVTITYNATNDTAVLKDGTVLTRVNSTTTPEAGAWIGWISDTSFVAIVLNGSKYMYAVVDLANNSYAPDAKGNRVNATEFGSYTITQTGEFSATPDAATDFTVVCTDTVTSGCDTVAGDSNGNDGFNSFSNVVVKFVETDRIGVQYTQDGINKLVYFTRIVQNGSKYETNTPPVANAGKDQDVETGSTVTLDGLNSYDANSDSLVYTWSIKSKPTGSKATISGVKTVNPSFVADVDGVYIVELTVDDAKATSKDTVTITAKAKSTQNVDAFPAYKYRAWGMGGDADNSKAQVTLDSTTYTVLVFSTKDIAQESASTSGDVTTLLGNVAASSARMTVSQDYLNTKLVVKVYKSATVFDATTFVASSQEIAIGASGTYVEFKDISIK
jgi:hypothetical protein